MTCYCGPAGFPTWYTRYNADYKQLIATSTRYKLKTLYRVELRLNPLFSVVYRLYRLKPLILGSRGGQDTPGRLERRCTDSAQFPTRYTRYRADSKRLMTALAAFPVELCTGLHVA
jgi:hypothetical protein